MKYGTFRSEVEMKDVFARFDYDLTDDVNFYLQGSWGESANTSNWINWVVSPSASRPNTLFANNPFLDPVTQQQLGASVVCGTPAATGWRCLPAIAGDLSADREHAPAAADDAVLLGAVVHLEQRGR